MGGIRGLDDFFPVHSGKFEPLYTAPDGTHDIAPEDLAKIYTYSGTTALGQGQTIAVVGQSDIKLADIEKFRSTFLLPLNDPKLLLVGEDPGIDSGGGELEADLDLEWSGAVASQANIVYVYAQNALDAAQQAIDQNLATILSSSYTACESSVPVASAAALRDLAQQANAQGMTWVAASGDAGAAACDQGSYPAAQGLAVNLPASFPEVTGIGGTEFSDGPNSWQSINNTDFSSVNGYIPEIAWNDTSPTLHLEGSGGGASALYAKPAWQIGPGVPNDGARDVPDLAFTASPNHDPFLLISGGQTYTGGGTSVSAPVFAGMLALEHQQMALIAPGVRLGNINPTLYVLAAAPTPIGGVAIFHDVISGNNSVPCDDGTPSCVNGSLGYNAGPGYDLVTGLGSINVASFEQNFRLATVTTLTASATQVTEGSSITLTARVTEFNGNVPAGSMNIYDASAPYPVAEGNLDTTRTMTSTLRFSPGTHALTAIYEGGNLMGSTSAPMTVVVIPNPPAVPDLPSPSNQSASISVSTSISWNQTQTSSASYDIYFGTSSPPSFWGTVTTLQCAPSGLIPNTTYYWKVVARNTSGTATSPIWSFTTSTNAVYTVRNIAGTGQRGFSGDGGPAVQAQLSFPEDVTIDRNGNLYIADAGNHRIRKITPGGIISTYAGTGTAGYSGDGGPALAAELNQPLGVTVDAQGNLFISDGLNYRVRKVSPDGIISTIAGNGTSGHSGDGGPATSAELYEPLGLALDPSGNLYIADSVIEQFGFVRRVAGGTISTVAGSPTLNSGAGFGGPATQVYLNYTQGVAVDQAANLYISDGGIDKVSNGIITAINGFQAPIPGNIDASRIALDAAGNIYVSASPGIAKISNNTLTTIAGGGSFGPVDGMPATGLGLAGAGGIAVDSSGTVYFTDGSNVIALLPSYNPSTAISAAGVVNAASFSSGAVAPGSIVSVFGSFLLTRPTPSTGTPLPTSLSGISIQFQSANGVIAAPLFYVSSGQVNIQIPWELAGQTTVVVNPALNGGDGAQQTIKLAPVAPGIFAMNGQGAGQGAILDTSYRLVDCRIQRPLAVLFRFTVRA